MTTEAIEEVKELNEKLIDKKWKTRVGGYEELETLIKSNNTDINQYLIYFENMANDSNAVAFESGLQTMITFFSLYQDPKAIEIGKKVCGLIGEKGLVGRPKAKERTLELYSLLIEIGIGEEVMDSLISLSKHKNLKLSAEAIKEVEQIFMLFGPELFSLRIILDELKEWMVHKDKEARQSAIRILHCLSSHFEKQLLQQFIDNIPAAQKKDYDIYVEANPFVKEPPKRTLRGAVKQVIDPTKDLIQEVILEQKIPTEFYSVIVNGKWKEKKEIIERVIEELQSPKIAFPNSSHFWDALKKALEDSNINVVSATIRCIVLIDQKGGNGSQFVGQIAKRLKESNRVLVNYAVEGLVSLSKSIDDIIPALTEAEGTSVSNLNVMRVVQKLIEKFNQPTQQTRLWAKLFCLPLEDQRKESRDEATEAIVSFIKINGNEIMKFLEGVSNDRLGIIQAKVNGESFVSQFANSFAHPNVSQISEITPKGVSPIPKSDEFNKPLSPVIKKSLNPKLIASENSPNRMVKSFSTTKIPVMKTTAKPLLRSAKTQPKPNLTVNIKTTKASFAELFRTFKGGDWKIQTQCLLEISNFLENNTISQGECDNLVSELKNKIADPKRGLASTALKTLIQIIRNVKIGFERYIPSIMSIVIQQMGDSNRSIRECSIEVMETVGKEVGMNTLINQLNYALQPNNNPIIRKSAMEVLLKVVETINEKEIGILKPLIGTLLKQLCDKNIELRKNVEYVIEKCVENLGIDIVKNKMHKLMVNEQQACKEIIRRYNISQNPTVIETNDNGNKLITKKLTHLITVCRDSEINSNGSEPISSIQRIGNKMDEEENEQQSTRMEEVQVLPIRKSLSLIQEGNKMEEENTKYLDSNRKEAVPKKGSPIVTLLNRCATVSMVVEDTKKQQVIVRSQTMIPPELTLLYKIPETYIIDLLRLGAEILPQDYLQKLVSLTPREVDLCIKAVGNLDYEKVSVEEFLMTWGTILIMKGDYTLFPEFSKIVEQWIKKIIKNKKSLDCVRTHTFIECMLKSAQYISTEVYLLMKYFVKVYEAKQITELLWRAYLTSPLATKIVCLRLCNDLFESFVEKDGLDDQMMGEIFKVVYQEAMNKNTEDVSGFLLAKIYNRIGPSIFEGIERKDEMFNQYIQFNGKYLKQKEEMNQQVNKRKMREERITIIGTDQPISIAENNEDIISQISGLSKEQKMYSTNTGESKKMEEESGLNLEDSETKVEKKNLISPLVPIEKPKKFSLTLQRGTNPIQLIQNKEGMKITIENKPLEEIIPKRMSEEKKETSGIKMIDLEERSSMLEKTLQDATLQNKLNQIEEPKVLMESPLLSPVSTKDIQMISVQISPHVSPIQSPTSPKSPKSPQVPPTAMPRLRPRIPKKAINKTVTVPRNMKTLFEQQSEEKTPVSSAVRVNQLGSNEREKTQPTPQQQIPTKKPNKLSLIKSVNGMNKKIEIVSPMVKPLIKPSSLEVQDVQLSMEIPSRQPKEENNSNSKTDDTLGFLDKILTTTKKETPIPPQTKLDNDIKLEFAQKSTEMAKQMRKSFTLPKPSLESPIDKLLLRPTRSANINPQLLALQTSINSIRRVSPIRRPIGQINPASLQSSIDWRDLCK